METSQSNQPGTRSQIDCPGAILDTWCWSLMLEDLVLSSGYSQLSFGEFKFMLLSTCMTSILAPRATLSMNPLGDDRSNCGKRPINSHRMGHPTYLIIKIFLGWSHPLVSIHRRQIYPCIFAHSERSTHITFPPKFLVTNFLIAPLPSPWPFRQTISHMPWISI